MAIGAFPVPVVDGKTLAAAAAICQQLAGTDEDEASPPPKTRLRGASGMQSPSTIAAAAAVAAGRRRSGANASADLTRHLVEASQLCDSLSVSPHVRSAKMLKQASRIH